MNQWQKRIHYLKKKITLLSMQTKEVIFVSEKVTNLESMISQFPNIACSYF